ncbi:MAG: elongation factor G [Chloroflexi bacterium]|nr:elongation factor G [Chloroflexota bacterium]
MVQDPQNIRNVVLLGHTGSGKTSLAEAMLFAAGVITRIGKVADGTTVSDYEPESIKRRTGVSTAVLPLEWKGMRVNVLDTPGYFDYACEVAAALSAADAAIVVVDAASGVQVGTNQMWRQVRSRSLPCLLVVNQLDRDNTDFFKVLDQVQAKLDKRCLPLQVPVGSAAEFQGVVELIPMAAQEGQSFPLEKVPTPLRSRAQEARLKTIEAIAEQDDALLTKYLEGEELTAKELVKGLRTATRAGGIYPVLAAAGLANTAIPSLLEAIVELLPSPAEVPLPTPKRLDGAEPVVLKADPQGPLAAQVFKTTADPYVGKLSIFRVFSGILASDSRLWNASKGAEERIGQLFLLRGKSQEPVAQVVAGGIGAIAKLATTGTGDTLVASRDQSMLFPPIEFPKGLFTMAVHPKSKADLDKMSTALARLVEEDPSLSLRREPATGEMLLTGMGDTHLEVAAERLQRKFGTEVVLTLPRVPYKETITTSTRAEFKHKKQSGGHGQYGHVFLEFEPLPTGTGFEFGEKVVGGSVPKEYIPAVEKGVVKALQEGILAGYPVTDVKITLYDGSYHPVDSSGMAFEIATVQGVKKGLAQAQPTLIEPIVNLRVIVPDSLTGDVISDLSGKRARVLGMGQQDGSTVVEAQAPLAELLRYAMDLRSLTQGRGSYTTEISHYEPVPAHVSERIISEAKAAAGKE